MTCPFLRNVVFLKALHENILTPEIVFHKKTGYLVPPENPQALAEAWLYVGRHPERTRKVAESALRFVNDNLTFDRQNRKLTAIYRKLLSE